MSIEHQPVAVGYAGLGKYARQSHIEPQLQDPNAYIQGLHDIDGAALLEVAHRSAPWADTTTDWATFVNSPRIDAIYALTPDAFHTSQLLDLVKANKHAFVEKPLADTLDDYSLLRPALLNTPENIVISSCHPRRFDPPFVSTRRLLEDRQQLAAAFGLPLNTDFGPVRNFQLNLNYSRPSRDDMHRSFAVDHLPHEMDIVSYFFGLKGIAHAASRLNQKLQFDVEMLREDGIALRFQGNRLQSGQQYREDWHIGFDGDIVLSVDAHLGTIALTQNGEAIGVPWAESKIAQMFKTDYDRRFQDLNRHFIASVRGIKQPYVSRAELLMNTAVGLALEETVQAVSISEDGYIRFL